MSLPLPVTVIGGYLGAGKTTMVNHLLRNANGLRLAILVNEFGAIADRRRLDRGRGRRPDLNRGGLCVLLLRERPDRRHRGPADGPSLRQSISWWRPPAWPCRAAVVASLGADGGDPARRDRWCWWTRKQCVKQASQTTTSATPITRQLADAEIVVINKRDLISDSAAHSACPDRLTALAPHAVADRSRLSAQSPLDAVLGAVAQRRRAAATDTGGHSDSPVRQHRAAPRTARFDAAATGRAAGHRARWAWCGLKGYVAGDQTAPGLVGANGGADAGRPSQLDHQPDPQLVCIGAKGQLRQRRYHRGACCRAA